MTINISAHIEENLATKLEKVCQFEGRSKSYYIKKGLALILDPKFQDIQDMISAKKTMDAVKKSNEKLLTFDEVFEDID